jgi:hypothetical protein
MTSQLLASGKQVLPVQNGEEEAASQALLQNARQAQVEKQESYNYNNLNTEYFTKLFTTNKYIWDNIKNLKIFIEDKNTLTLIGQFAKIQDTLYGITTNSSIIKKYNNNEYYETYLDDFLAIAFINHYDNDVDSLGKVTRLFKEEDIIAFINKLSTKERISDVDKKNFSDILYKILGKKEFIKLLSVTHDAWSYARIVKFKDSINYFKSFGRTPLEIVEFKEVSNEISVTLNIEKNFKPVLQLKRISQLVEFTDLLKLNEKEAMKDVVPIIAYICVISQLDVRAQLAEIEILLFKRPTRGGKSKNLPYEKRTVKQLQSLAKSRNIKFSPSLNKSDLINLLRKSK